MAGNNSWPWLKEPIMLAPHRIDPTPQLFNLYVPVSEQLFPSHDHLLAIAGLPSAC
jgi:hypothetical protein